MIFLYCPDEGEQINFRELFDAVIELQEEVESLKEKLRQMQEEQED